VLQISKIFWGSTPQTPHTYVVCWPHTWPSAIASPSNILSHRKVPFQTPPHGKILKKGPAVRVSVSVVLWFNDLVNG
jgi:hypothetical protein